MLIRLRYLLLLFVAFTTGGMAADSPWRLLSHDDYVKHTSCLVAASDYAHLGAALDHLVFAEVLDNSLNDDVAYARRHTRPFFSALWYAHQDAGGFVREQCLPPSLLRIGRALGLLDARGHYSRDAEGSVKPRIVADEHAHVDSEAYTLQSRLGYIGSSGCLVTRESYLDYRAALYHLLFGSGSREQAQAQMRDFLAALAASRPTASGQAEQSCLTRAVSRVAASLGVLGEGVE